MAPPMAFELAITLKTAVAALSGSRMGCTGDDVH
jgi:hypothetical protein